MKSRSKAILACTLVVLLFAVLFIAHGYDATWRLWNIPTMSPHFADLRTITHGAESYSQGLDPMVENPADPWQRRLNYPRIWQSLFSLGINETHTTWLGLAVIFFFLAGVCLMLPHASNAAIIVVFSAVLSPATLLGAERANIDLLIFFLISISVLAAQRSLLLSALTLLAGFALKLFPVFAWAVLLKAGRSKFVLYTLVMLVIVGSYSLATLQDLLLIREGTPKSTNLSYGMNVLWMTLGNINASLGTYARAVSYLSVLLIFAFAFFAFLRGDRSPGPHSDTLYLDAFRAGAAIHIGTFLLGNNWDYRLVFLIFTLPQLLLWTKHSAVISFLSKLTLTAVFVSLWHLIFAVLFDRLPYGYYISVALDQSSSWAAFAGLVCLFFWSAPAWVKELVATSHPATHSRPTPGR